MTLTWPRLHMILNSSLLFFSLVLVAISPAILYLTIHGMRMMEHSWPQRSYTWYRGPSYDMNTKHQVALKYEVSDEHMILAAAAASVLAGVIGVAGFFLAGEIISGSVSFVVTFITFIYTQSVFDTDNMGKCDWTQGYVPWSTLKCTREQAACNIVGYFAMESWEMAQKYHQKLAICHDTRTGRHLVAPLFVASSLVCGIAIGKLFVERREMRFVETADERAEKLERQGE